MNHAISFAAYVLNSLLLCLPATGKYLEKPGLIQRALEREDEWRRAVPGHANDTTWAVAATLPPMNSLERSLTALRQERDLEQWAENPGNVFINMASSDIETVDVKMLDGRSSIHPVVIQGHPCLAGANLPDDIDLPARKEAAIVMIRHGKTEHNKLGLFTGWEDPQLANEGVEEAKLAGKMLKKSGFEFDIVYTSWLSRAIATSWHVLDGLDATWLPIVKSWRLNERSTFAYSVGRRPVLPCNLTSFSFPTCSVWRPHWKVQSYDC